jgi:phage terminase large subunit
MPVVKSLYVPRAYFLPFHNRAQRWATLVAHRRAGKTVAAVNDIIEKASYNTRQNPRYAYIAPLLKQAKQIAWQYLKDFARPFNPKINESELYVELTLLPNSPRITIYGADNPDSFRGLYFDGVVLDEFGNMRGSIWKEILLPALIDRRGWAVFMGTPNGPNHFRDTFYAALKDASWFKLRLTVEDTHIIALDDLAEMRKIMDPEEFEQEMMCNFEASVRGAIYARQIEQVIKDQRIGHYPLQKNVPTDVIMDLGVRDDTTMGFCQSRPDGVVCGHAHHDNLQPIRVYIEYIKDFWATNDLRPGQIWLPHDARAKSLQTGKTIVDHFIDAHLRPQIVPNIDLLDGIAAARKMFPIWYFNEPETEDLVLALKSYHRKYDEDLKRFIDIPVHDWSSHYADMFRYASIVLNREVKEKPKSQAVVVPDDAKGLHYRYCLDDIWDLTPTPRSNRL